jgi:hypothetical protein
MPAAPGDQPPIGANRARGSRRRPHFFAIGRCTRRETVIRGEVAFTEGEALTVLFVSKGTAGKPSSAGPTRARRREEAK